MTVDILQQILHSFSAMKTFIDSEEVCTDIGQFRRRALAIHSKTGQLVACKAAVADTFFSIPAVTPTEHGYITGGRDDGELEFRPHTDQTMTPTKYKKDYRRRCK